MKIKFYSQWSNRPKVKAYNGNVKSLVQRIPEGNLKQMVEKYVRTGEIPQVGSHSTYYDENFVEPQNFDLSDITENQDFINTNKTLLDNLSKKVKEKKTVKVDKDTSVDSN